MIRGIISTLQSIGLPLTTLLRVLMAKLSHKNYRELGQGQGCGNPRSQCWVGPVWARLFPIGLTTTGPGKIYFGTNALE